MKLIKLQFTDFYLLKTIYEMYKDDYLKRENNKTLFYIPIDCELVAKKMNVDAELVFQRLNFHLNKRYGYKQDDGSRVEFFAMKVDNVMHCINYPYLCSVLADMADNKKELRITQIISIAAIIISILVPLLGK